MMQAKVGPTSAPSSGGSAIPPVNRSMSSTLLKKKTGKDKGMIFLNLGSTLRAKFKKANSKTEVNESCQCC